MLLRYHKDVFFEVGALDEIKALIETIDLQPTKHFMKNWIKRGNVCIPTEHVIKTGNIFEYYREVGTGKIDRFAVRCTNISNNYDIIYVINNVGRIVTAWSNTKEEQHQNLRKELYEGGTRTILPSERKDTTKGNKASSRCEALIRKWKSEKHCRSSQTSWNR